METADIDILREAPSRLNRSRKGVTALRRKPVLRLLLERLPQYPLDPRVLKGLPVGAARRS